MLIILENNPNGQKRCMQDLHNASDNVVIKLDDLT
jgi:hypothetical protein